MAAADLGCPCCALRGSSILSLPDGGPPSPSPFIPLPDPLPGVPLPDAWPECECEWPDPEPEVECCIGVLPRSKLLRAGGMDGSASGERPNGSCRCVGVMSPPGGAHRRAVSLMYEELSAL